MTTYPYSFPVTLFDDDTGLDLSAQLYDTSGSPYGSEMEDVSSEIGGGLYIVDINIESGFRGSAVVYTSGCPSLIHGQEGIGADMYSDIESGYSLPEIMRAVSAVLFGKVSRSGDIITFRNIDDDKNRIQVQVNSSGERLSVTLNDLDE